MDGRVTRGPTTYPVLALAEVDGVDEVDDVDDADEVDEVDEVAEVDGGAVEEKEDAAF